MQERAERTRGAIIAGAASTFGERGYVGAGVAEIVRRSGTARGALYFHFAAKEELAEVVVDACEAQLVSGFVRAAAEASAHGLARELAALADGDLIVRAGLRLIVEGCPNPPAPRYRLLIDALAAQLAARGERGRPPSPAAGAEADALAFALVGALLGAQAMARTFGRPDRAQAKAERSCELLISGAQARARGAGGPSAAPSG
ncbi:TetR family transcriptional regulator [Streptomyces sp. 846.5]|nr:TetR/AcrR family transcriptional regulator [Streptomyces sp. 846.5]TDU02208.1 TetR family transcriptional regulator [Streptomyces sp. 846.5]